MKTLKKGYFSRVLSVILALMMIFSLCAVGITSAFAADVTLAEVSDNPANKQLFLKPNSDWKTDGARFAVYVFNNASQTNAWVSMTAYEKDTSLYVATVPDGDWQGVIFCRMNPSATENVWENKWNQTVDLTYSEGQNLFTINSWENGTWSRYGVHLSGDFNNWKEFDSDFEMELIDEAAKLYEYTTVLEAGTYEFKLLVGYQWRSVDSTIDDATTSALTVDSTTNANCTLVATGGTYTFTYNRDSGTLSVTHTPPENTFELELTVKHPDSVMVGDTIHIDARTNSEEEVTFKLYENDNLIQTNTVGEFFVETVAEDANSTPAYKLEVSTKVDGEEYIAKYDFEVEINPFEFNVTLSAPQFVEAGMKATLKATAVSNSQVTYKFFKADGTPVAENTAGTYTFDAVQTDIGKTLSFYVEATTTVLGQEYTASSEVVGVQITNVTEFYEVTLYFKSTSTIGYRPIITTSGAVQNLSDYSMTKSELIASKNISQTSTFYWYKADVQVSKASPSLTVNVVLSSRYAMEATLTFDVAQSGPVYLGVDDLNAGSEMVNMTEWTEAERNWTQSAVHSVYDAELDGEETLTELSANISLVSVGDANGDGKVNVKDATLIQKYLANLDSFDEVGKEISDVNDDGRVTIKDATAIQKMIADCL